MVSIAINVGFVKLSTSPLLRVIGVLSVAHRIWMSDQNWSTPKSRRCYHRVISGCQRPGKLRFLTLTSSNDSPDTCQNSFRALKMRMVRRGLLQGYIKVPEASKSGKQHLHVLFRGSYVEQSLLSKWWLDIHKAEVVDIRLVKGSRTPRNLASYMAKYMSKENIYRYSWNWGWVWRGFVRDWTKLKRLYRTMVDSGAGCQFSDLLRWWRLWLGGFWHPMWGALPRPLETALRG